MAKASVKKESNVTPLTQQPFKALKKRKTRSFTKVEPYYLGRLARACGSAKEAAGMIGVTPGTVSSALADNLVWKPTELAARQQYEEHYAPKEPAAPPPPRREVAVIVAEPAHMQTVRDMITGLGGSFKSVGKA